VTVRPGDSRDSRRDSDFRSDTVTRPTPEMRRAMAEAEVGDDVFGDDPTVNALERDLAAWFGREAALYVPTGTMGNQIAAAVHAPTGSEVILEESSHCLNYEVGGLAAISGLQTRPIAATRGVLDPAAVKKRLRAPTLHSPGTGLVIVENTHNFAGGAIVPLETLREIREISSGMGVPLHIDGARLWNASVATGVPMSDWAAQADSVSCCFSKGLGAPVGSILVGDTDFIAAARRMRKLLGGGLRQVGVLAAAARWSWENGFERLAEDHVRAKTLAAGMAARPGIVADLEEVETNLLFFTLESMTAVAFVEAMKEHGVLVVAAGPDRVRMVTHRDVDDDDVARALEAARAVVG